jgi:hypothetical protein
MTTTRTMRISPSRPGRVLSKLIMILSILSLVSCSLSFDSPWDKKVADGSQKKTSKTEAAPAQPASQPPPRLVSDAGDDGRKWSRYMTDDDDVRYLLDKDAITQLPKNIVRMWRKREFPPGATQKTIVTLDEIDCRKAELRTLELHVTYSDGSTGRSTEATRWVKIYSNSSEEYLMDEHCK